VKLLDGSMTCQRGRILVDGIDVRDWDPRVLRRRIAVVLQDVFLFSGSVEAKLITLGADIPRAAVEAAAVQRERPTGSSAARGLRGPRPRARLESLRRGHALLLAFPARARLAGQAQCLLVNCASVTGLNINPSIRAWTASWRNSGSWRPVTIRAAASGRATLPA